MTRRTRDGWVPAARRGALAGVLSGLAFTVALCTWAVTQGEPWHAPLRVIAAVALGSSALDVSESGAPLPLVLFWALALHLLFVSLTGAALAIVLARLGPRVVTPTATVAAALVYTLLWWPAGYYAIAPALGWWWFPAYMDQVPLLVELVLDVGVWGGALGAFLVILGRR